MTDIEVATPDQLLIWMDWETTGLDESDIPIAFACVVTDKDLDVLWQTPEYLIDPATTDIAAWQDYETGKGAAWDMHEKSGLNDLIRRGDSEFFLSRRDVLGHLTTFFTEHDLDGQKYPLAGSSVWFDRRLMLRWFPAIEFELFYRNVDVSSLKEIFKRWYPKTLAVRGETKPEDKAHRPLEDIAASIAELNWYRRFVLNGPNQFPDHRDALMARYAADYLQVSGGNF